MKILVLGLAFFGLILTENDAAKKELDKYQGTWVLVSEEYEAREIPFEELKDLDVTVKGNQLFFKSNGRDQAATIKFDPSKEPKPYDLFRNDGRLSVKDIYTWDGETIKICSADDQGARPTAFETRPGSPNRIRIWRRK